MDDKRLTPMLAQYRQIKARFSDAIVLFRLGDFYETFDADAKVAARELELVLTHRSFAKGVRLPMAGVPHHHVQSYIAKLIDKGYKVALVEQLEDPKKVKRLVKRDVIRIITPGTVVEDALLRAKSENYLAAIAGSTPPPLTRSDDALSNDIRVGSRRPSPTGRGEQGGYGLAFIDLSTGEFATTQVDSEAKLLDELERVQPSEYVLPESLAQNQEFVARVSSVRPARISPIPDKVFEEDTARHELLEHFRAATLHPFGCEELPLAISAAGAALYYLKTNQPNPAPLSREVQEAQGTNALSHLNSLWTYSLTDYMTLDAATRRNLELTASLASDSNLKNFSQRSLFGVLDQTITAMGARLLRRWINQPLLDLAQIHARQDAVDELVRDAFLRADLRKLLDGLYDVERLVGRIGFGTANARDLIGLKRALLRLPKIKARLQTSHLTPTPLPQAEGKDDQELGLLRELEQRLDPLHDVAELIDHALVDDPPILIKEGGLIKESYDPTLDELRDRAAHGRQWLNALEERERQRTGIKNLRVRYNEVFGFFIEVARRDGHLIPQEYERRATISHAERYVTPELKTQEANILATQDRAKDLEYELFVNVRREVATHSARLQNAARILAQLDTLCALAETAARYNYVKPCVDDGDVIEIREGRHPVVERFLREDESFVPNVFVPNDARLDHDTQRVVILTGPNMSGKSVFIRQIALMVLMAQIGSFVPAASARIGLTDRIFTRVGASDDIAQGRSTFLVEMSETSHILRHATARSLVVLDEVGRGTSTYDGISLAWAIAEELHNIVGAKTLFATHYHELTELAESPSVIAHGSAVRNFTMAVQERGSQVVFLRQVIEGGAEKSFGIHVAQLAGLPSRVIERAEQVLNELETERGNGRKTDDERRMTNDEGQADEHSLIFNLPSTVNRERSAIAREQKGLYDARVDAWREILRQLNEADIANMTPVQALVMLNELQTRIKSLQSLSSNDPNSHPL